jgi:hypothetical protein
MTAKQLATEDMREDDDIHSLRVAERKLIDFLLDDPPDRFVSLDANFHPEPNFNSNTESLGYMNPLW